MKFGLFVFPWLCILTLYLWSFLFVFHNLLHNAAPSPIASILVQVTSHPDRQQFSLHFKPPWPLTMTKTNISTISTDLGQIQTLTTWLDFQVYYPNQMKTHALQPHPEVLYLLLRFCQTLTLQQTPLLWYVGNKLFLSRLLFLCSLHTTARGETHLWTLQLYSFIKQVQSSLHNQGFRICGVNQPLTENIWKKKLHCCRCGLCSKA